MGTYSEGAKLGWERRRAKFTADQIAKQQQGNGKKRWEGVSKKKRTLFARTIRKNRKA